jgi:hypothetical protein
MSKRKGNAGELELCKKLKEIFNGSFIRVPNSGAFTGGKNAFRKEQLSDNQNRASKGDIIPPDFMPKLVLESKFYKDFRFHQLLQPGSCIQLDEWIGQSLDANDPGDVWFVCFKINLRGWYIAVPFEGSSEYTFENHVHYTGDHGKFIVTSALEFFAANRDIILKQTA